MNTFTLPEPILDQARTEAMRCKIPLDEFIADAVTEKLAALNAHFLLNCTFRNILYSKPRD